MTTSKYELITGACVGVAVASAIAFDATGSLRWLPGLAGAAAGVTAAAAYFVRAMSCETRDSQPERREDRVNIEACADVGDLQPVPHHPDLLGAQGTLWEDVGEISRVSTFHHRRHYFAVRYYKRYAAIAAARERAANEMVSGLLPERRMFVDEVVELVNRLAPTCEVELTFDGRITIRSKALPKSIEDFERASTAATRPPENDLVIN